jgi:hypothetical protein
MPGGVMSTKIARGHRLAYAYLPVTDWNLISEQRADRGIFMDLAHVYLGILNEMFALPMWDERRIQESSPLASRLVKSLQHRPVIIKTLNSCLIYLPTWEHNLDKAEAIGINI